MRKLFISEELAGRAIHYFLDHDLDGVKLDLWLASIRGL